MVDSVAYPPPGRRFSEHGLDRCVAAVAPDADSADGRAVPDVERRVLNLQRGDRRTDLGRDPQGRWSRRLGEQAMHAMFEEALHVAGDRSLAVAVA